MPIPLQPTLLHFLGTETLALTDLQQQRLQVCENNMVSLLDAHVTNLLIFLESLTSHVHQRLPVDVLYLDFNKAFDKVPHQRLISKLRAHGIGPEISRWIENWLTDRKQRVTIKGTQSPWTSGTSGVPQGSVLGPTLFTIYINDIDENIKSQILKFADDTKLMTPVSNQEQTTELQEDLASAFHWAGKWQGI